MTITVKTVKSRSEYRVKMEDGMKYLFVLRQSGDAVDVYTPTSCIGGYNLSRFGGELSPSSIRNLFI